MFARPRTPGTVSAVRVLTTTQLLYNIESPHREDSHSFFHPSLLERQLSLSSGAFSNLLALRYDSNTAPVQAVPALLRPLFHTCTDVTPLWWPHIGRHYVAVEGSGGPSCSSFLGLQLATKHNLTTVVDSHRCRLSGCMHKSASQSWADRQQVACSVRHDMCALSNAREVALTTPTARLYIPQRLHTVFLLLCVGCQGHYI